MRSLPLFPVDVVHCHVVYLCHETAFDVHVRAFRSTEARASTCPPLFLICASNHATPRTRDATRVDVVLANIDSEKRRTMALIFCFQWPLCLPQPRTATERLLSTPANPRLGCPTFLRPSLRTNVP